MTSKKLETIIVKNIDPDPSINRNWLVATLKPLVKGIDISSPGEVMRIGNIPPEQMEVVINKIRDSGLEIIEN